MDFEDLDLEDFEALDEWNELSEFPRSSSEFWELVQGGVLADPSEFYDPEEYPESTMD